MAGHPSQYNLECSAYDKAHQHTVTLSDEDEAYEWNMVSREREWTNVLLGEWVPHC